MTRTQIQLPDELYRRAKKLADAKEISLAELLRRGLETILERYPDAHPVNQVWHPPLPRNLGWRGLNPDEMHEAALADAEPPPPASSSRE